MSEDEHLNRRDFTTAGLMALFGGMVITVAACGGDGASASPTAPSGVPTMLSGADRVGTISANHRHTAVLTAARLAAARAVTLDIRGSSNHPHTVELSAAEVAQARDGQRVAKTSSTDSGSGFGNHSHLVTFNA